MSQKSGILEISTLIGFSGGVNNSLISHPSGKHLIYPLGSTLIVRDLSNNQNNDFLIGHSGPITCVAISKSGRYIASGQSTHMGFQADVIVWDFQKRKLIYRMTLHKVKVQCLNFSHDEQFLVSSGGQDDNTVVIWNLSTGKPVAGDTAHTNLTRCVAFYNNTNTQIVTAGDYFVRVWDVDYRARKIHPQEGNTGQLKRIFNVVHINDDDTEAYFGTLSGDVVCVQLNGPKNIKYGGPKKKFEKGVHCLQFTPNGILVGGGAGALALLDWNLKLKKRIDTLGGVTSISRNKGGTFIGTTQSVIYKLGKGFKLDLIATCHSKRINDVIFPKETSKVFATCSLHDIRLWNSTTSQELLRIQVPNRECNCICFNEPGSAIISGWSDGKVRAFTPTSGKLLYVINDAHKTFSGNKKSSGALVGVTAIHVSHDNTKLITGGSDGDVRIWKINKNSHQLIASMKEHKATVNTIHLRKDDSECITASDDGSCIVWNCDKASRRNIMYAQTYFKAAQYLDDESQIVTAGTDKKITYWDSSDCSPIREIEGEKYNSKPLNALSINKDGTLFACAGEEKLIKVFGYDSGDIVKVGRGHAGTVRKVRFSPCQNYLVSVGDEGAIFLYKLN